MPKISLRGVRVLRGCEKPNCSTGVSTLNRHHKRHEAMWRGVWSKRRRGEPAWDKFLKRYFEFRPEDTVVVCESHHAEIHVLYDQIIKADRDERGKNLSQYSWSEARQLMTRLEDCCLEWLDYISPGISSELYGRTKDQQRKIKNIRSKIKQILD
jgi:hypothetical protein